MNMIRSLFHNSLLKVKAAFGELKRIRLSIQHLRLPLIRHKKFILPLTVLIIALILNLSSPLFASDFITYDSSGNITGKYISKSDHLFYEGQMGAFIKIDREEIRKLDRFDKVDILTEKVYRLSEIEITAITDIEEAKVLEILTLEKLKKVLIDKGVLNEKDF